MTAKGSLKASFLELLKTWCPGASWGDLVGSLELWIPLSFEVQSGRTTTLLRAHAAQQRGTIENDKNLHGTPLAGAWRSNERPAVLSEGRRRKRNSDWPHSKSQHMRAQNLRHLPKASAPADRGETHSVQQGSASWKTSTKRCSSKGQNLAGELHEAKGRRLTTSNDIRRRPVPGTQSKTTQRDAWSCVKYRALHVVGGMTSEVG